MPRAAFEGAARELSRFSPEDQLRLLDALESKRKEEHYLKYFQPTPEQIDALHKFTADVKTCVWVGGNRSGKTVLGAFVALAWALGKEYFQGEASWDWVKDLPIPDKPNNIWVVGLDFSVLRDVIWQEKFKGHPSFLPKDDHLIKNIREDDLKVFFANGSVITCKSADSGRAKFQSASVDLVWIDEEPEAEIYDECYQRTADCAGKLLVTLTPLTDMASGVREPWVYKLNERMRDGDTDITFASLSTLHNPYIPGAEKDRLVKRWAGHTEERARLYGDFIHRSGLVYPMWDTKSHLIEPFEIPKKWMHVVMIDPASTGPTAALWAAVDPEGNLVIYREYKDKNLVVSDHARNILLRNGSNIVDMWLIDPRWGSQRGPENHKQNFQLYKDAGIPVRLAPVDEDYGLNASLEYMQATVTPGSRHPKVTFFKDLRDTQFEIEHYVYAQFARGDRKGLTKDKPLKRDDHLLNCFQYIAGMKLKQRRQTTVSAEEKFRSARLNSYTQPTGSVYDQAQKFLKDA